jgi:hypothetical protein
MHVILIMILFEELEVTLTDLAVIPQVAVSVGSCKKTICF